jgi:hypothetical protein
VKTGESKENRLMKKRRTKLKINKETDTLKKRKEEWEIEKQCQ